MTDKPYTDADVELVAEAAYESDNYDTHGGWYVPWADVHKRVRHEYERGAGKALDALAAAGRLARAVASTEPEQPALGSPADRAQDADHWMNRRALVSDTLGPALAARGYDVPLPVRDRCAEAVIAAQDAKPCRGCFACSTAPDCQTEREG